MTAQRADGKPAIFKLRLEIPQRNAIGEHRQWAMRVARIIARAQLHAVDIDTLQFVEDLDRAEACSIVR